MAVAVSMILERKGSGVFGIRPDAMLLAAVDKLAEHGVGALVVTDDGTTVVGIISERDIVREMARRGTGAVKQTVADVMSTEVTTCSPETTCDELMAIMTRRRIRHVPVMGDDGLCGIVSIGDVIKVRLDELEVATQSLEQYVTGSV
ncbi:MAG TPA: CBS domain-containing protein [Egibacteraceae bacterium]|nr:CBS domain-containing protein [Egibacteraceae bacterium]